ncbi:MAG: hypothetical protein K2W96_10430 [Gemmataceae bacterium]|nr:hypothetical protein [Gemmataceae bacterium]
MSRIVFNVQALADVRGATGVVEVCDGAGRVVGYFHPAREASSPYTREQLEEFRKQRTGRPLSGVLADLEKRWGSPSPGPLPPSSSWRRCGWPPPTGPG